MYYTDRNSKKNNPFTIPENYFEEFHSNLMKQLPAKENYLTKSHIDKRYNLQFRHKRYLGYAAIITLFLLISGTFLFQNIYINDTTVTEITEAERNDIIETIFDNYTIDDYNIYCYLTSSDSNF